MTLAFKEGPYEPRINELKAKLDGLVESEKECEDFLYNEPDSASVTDCVVYYVTGFLCRKLLKCTECLACKTGLTASANMTRPEAALVIQKTRGGLLHANVAIFSLVKEIEDKFQRHASDKNVYDITVDYILDNYKMSFACREHKVDIMAQVVHYYVALRMRQYCKQLKKNEENKTQKLRKLSKLV